MLCTGVRACCVQECVHAVHPRGGALNATAVTDAMPPEVRPAVSTPLPTLLGPPPTHPPAHPPTTTLQAAHPGHQAGGAHHQLRGQRVEGQRELTLLEDQPPRAVLRVGI